MMPSLEIRGELNRFAAVREAYYDAPRGQWQSLFTIINARVRSLA